jgi:hypothetical protein
VTTPNVLLMLLLGLLAGACLTLAAPRAWQAVRPLVSRLLGNRLAWYLLSGPWRQLGWRVGRWRRGRGPCGVRGSATNDWLRGAGVGLRFGPGGLWVLHCPRCAPRPATGGRSP